VSLRTYPLIIHPAFISYVEHELGQDRGFHALPTSETPSHLPSIRDVHDVAEYLKVSPFLFRSMLKRPRRHYRVFSFKKRSGGTRLIYSPRTFLKVVQWWILDTILNNCTVSPHAHGFTKGRSFVTNARTHFGARHIACVDIRDFFPSIQQKHVCDLFLSMGYEEEVADNLSMLTTLNGSLPQGAPTSPAIANLIMRSVDDTLSQFSSRIEATYTRYADDLTFSSTTELPSEIPNVVNAELASIGLALNNEKTRFMGPNDRKEVTGLVLGLNDIRLDPSFLNSARGWFHSAWRDPIGHVGDRERIQGTIALIEQVKGAGSAHVAALGQKALRAIALVPAAAS
jgi:RNA-directed DNA polymerase